MSTTNDTAQVPRHLRVFLASPGDVAQERVLALRVLEDLQYEPLLRGQITVETVAWDKPGAGAPMLATLTPQEAIKQGLPKPSECDIVITIFWSRMGTPLPAEYQKSDGNRYLSGTEWEYLEALEAAERAGKPEILVYRRSEKIALDPDDHAFEDKTAQWRQVKNFFAAFLNPDGSIKRSWNDYPTPEAFQKDLRLHLQALIKRLVPELQTTLSVSGPAQPAKPDLRPATAHYLSYLQDRHQYLSLKGMGLSERVPLQLPLLDLYVPLQARLELPPGETWDRNLRLGRAVAGD